MLPLINSSYFQNLVEGFTNGVLIVNTNGEVYVANTAAAHTLGCTVDQCNGKSWRELLNGIVYSPQFEGFMRDATSTDRCNLPFFTPYIRPDGQTRYLNLSTSPLVEWNKLFGIMILITDVTPLHHMHEREKAILTENNKLQHERYESLQNISQAIAHQIRNPMMTIGGFAGLLLRRSGNGSKGCDSEFLEGILDASRRLEEIVNAVSQFTSLSIRNPAPIEIGGILDEARETIAARVAENGSRVFWDVRLEPARMVLDHALLVTALQEIMENSLEAFENGSGRMSVRGSKTQENYLLVLADDGAGIEAAHLPYVTDPFFTTKAVGVGMGLTNVERIVREHKGGLFISSRQGVGTTVSIELPLDFTSLG